MKTRRFVVNAATILRSSARHQGGLNNAALLHTSGHDLTTPSAQRLRTDFRETTVL
jgi:hypothetical protein